MVWNDVNIIKVNIRVRKNIPAIDKVISYREASHEKEKCQQSIPAAKRRKKESWVGKTKWSRGNPRVIEDSQYDNIGIQEVWRRSMEGKRCGKPMPS